MANPWVRSWQVVGTSGKPYKVSQRQDGTFGCSCPAWMFSKVHPRPDCQHILRKRMELNEIPVKVSKSKKHDDNQPTRSITFED